MKNYIIILLTIGLVFNACKNSFEKEIGEVDGLINIITETENILLSIDTSRAFTASRQIKSDLEQLNAAKDTLTKEEAFRLDDYYSGKKKLYRLASDYASYNSQINFSKTQLANLKQDLTNGKITKEDFSNYYESEHAVVFDLNSQINKAVNGLEETLEKLRIDREEILNIIEQHKQKAAESN